MKNAKKNIKEDIKKAHQALDRIAFNYGLSALEEKTDKKMDENFSHDTACVTEALRGIVFIETSQKICRMLEEYHDEQLGKRAPHHHIMGL